MKKFFTLLAVMFGLVIAGTVIDNGNETDSLQNYTVIDSGDEEEDYENSDDVLSIAAVALNDEILSIDEPVSSNTDSILDEADGDDLPKTVDEAKEKLEQAKEKALYDYENAVAKAEAEYERAVFLITGESNDVDNASETTAEDENTQDTNSDEEEAEAQDVSGKSPDESEASQTEEKEDTETENVESTVTESSDNHEAKNEISGSENDGQIKEQEESANKTNDNIIHSEPAEAPIEPENNTVEQETVSQADSTQLEDTGDEEESDGKVWIPASGKKYHKKKDCSNMKSPTKVTKDYAKSNGYTPCKKCYKNQ